MYNLVTGIKIEVSGGVFCPPGDTLSHKVNLTGSVSVYHCGDPRKFVFCIKGVLLKEVVTGIKW